MISSSSILLAGQWASEFERYMQQLVGNDVDTKKGAEDRLAQGDHGEGPGQQKFEGAGH